MTKILGGLMKKDPEIRKALCKTLYMGVIFIDGNMSSVICMQFMLHCLL